MNRLMEGKNTSSPDPLTPSQPQITPYDEQFMEKVMAYNGRTDGQCRTND